MFQLRNILFVVIATAITIGLAAGCSDDVASTESDARVRVLLTDAPFPFELVDEANVTIQRVELIGSEGTVLLNDDAQDFNLLLLQNGLTVSLAEVDVPADTYHQIRLLVGEDAEVVMNDDEVYDLKVPSGTETGIKVNLNSLVVEDEDLAIITVDFSVEESFVVQGNPETPAGIRGFIFKPVLHPVSVEIE